MSVRGLGSGKGGVARSEKSVRHIFLCSSVTVFGSCCSSRFSASTLGKFTTAIESERVREWEGVKRELVRARGRERNWNTCHRFVSLSEALKHSANLFEKKKKRRGEKREETTSETLELWLLLQCQRIVQFYFWNKYAWLKGSVCLRACVYVCVCHGVVVVG